MGRERIIKSGVGMLMALFTPVVHRYPFVRIFLSVLLLLSLLLLLFNFTHFVFNTGTYILVRQANKSKET